MKTLHVDGGNDDGDRSLYVFALHNADKWAGTLHHTAMKLYSFKIYEGDVLKRDFVPCVETATGKAGLYDLADGRFYGNAGSGVDFRTAVCVTAANFESYRTLQNGNTYLFTEDVDFTASACQSAMTVADGATATIRVARVARESAPVLQVST